MNLKNNFLFQITNNWHSHPYGSIFSKRNIIYHGIYHLFLLTRDLKCDIVFLANRNIRLHKRTIEKERIIGLNDSDVYGLNKKFSLKEIFLQDSERKLSSSIIILSDRNVI